MQVRFLPGSLKQTQPNVVKLQKDTGCGASVARQVRDLEARGSIPRTPTIFKNFRYIHLYLIIHLYYARKEYQSTSSEVFGRRYIKTAGPCKCIVLRFYCSKNFRSSGSSS